MTENTTDKLSEQGRPEIAKKFGLGSDATWSEISGAISEQNRREEVEKLGLASNASWADISNFRSAQSAINRGEGHPDDRKQMRHAINRKPEAGE